MGEDAGVARAEVLLVGTFHMANPGADLANVRVDDVLAPHRQQELDAVVRGLARFQPTKVVVEHPWDDTELADAFDRFVVDGGSGSRSETHQLGFRLARSCGHPTVHGVDVMDGFYDPAIEQLTADPEHRARWDALVASAEAFTARIGAALASGTIGAVLALLNTPEERAAMLRPYLESLLPLASPPSWPGPDMAANWYRRNFRIAANLLALAEEGDRIVVIYGAGHIPVLEHVLRSIQSYRVVDPRPFLA